MQEKLKTTPVVTATADLTQKQRLVWHRLKSYHPPRPKGPRILLIITAVSSQERENELAQLRNRFQRGNAQKLGAAGSAKVGFQDLLFCLKQIRQGADANVCATRSVVSVRRKKWQQMLNRTAHCT